MAILIVGIPLPSSAKKSIAEPFPCQSCPCGCVSAAQCWEQCCCHSDDEKLIWAKQHGVKPPAFLVARVELAHAGEIKLAACCATARSCCSKAATQSTDSDPEVSSVRVVTIDAMHKCQGIELAIKLLSVSIVACGRNRLGLLEALFLYAMVLGDEFTESVAESIDPPIP